jgi:hypothetical protein
MLHGDSHSIYTVSMGTDIAPYVAYRSSKGELQPFLYGSQELGRDYMLYGLMAGVRGDAELFQPRGLPDDTPSIYQIFFEKDGGDGYAASWLSTIEMKAVAEKYQQITEEQNGLRYITPHLAALIGLMEAVDIWAEKYDPGGRAILIFWFDG